jgi:hypothetical protein
MENRRMKIHTYTFRKYVNLTPSIHIFWLIRGQLGKLSRYGHAGTKRERKYSSSF